MPRKSNKKTPTTNRPDLVMTYRSPAAKLTLLLMITITPVWAVYLPMQVFNLLQHVNVALQYHEKVSPLEVALITGLSFVVICSILLLCICIDDKLVLGKDGVRLPSMFLLHTRGQQYFTWKRLRSIVFEKHRKPSSDPDILCFDLVGVLKPRLNIRGFGSFQRQSFLEAVHAFSPRTKVFPREDQSSSTAAIARVAGATPTEQTSSSTSNELHCPKCDQTFHFTKELTRCPVDDMLLVLVSVDPLIGKSLDDKYEIISFLGCGGWSRVYQARHRHLGELRAVKVLDVDLAIEGDKLRRFQNEARASVSLVHPNIVVTYDHGLIPQPYIVMELVEGLTLDQWFKRNGPLTLEQFTRSFGEVCQGMTHAHDAGLIHRDLTPNNIIIDAKSGTAKILDFGLVKVCEQTDTKTGETVGSPPYMSPEQCMGQALDARSDIYSLGCVMYEALTGVCPFVGHTPVDTMYKHFTEKPRPISQLRSGLPPALDNLIDRCLASHEDRYKSMEELRQDLNRIASGSSVKRVRYSSRLCSPKSIIRIANGLAAIGCWLIVVCGFAFQVVSLLNQ